jgi:hypothetical protein
MKYKILSFFIILLFMNSYSEDFVLKNTSIYSGLDKWNWTIYIDKDTSNIRKISKVLYSLPEFYGEDTILITSIGDTLHPFSYKGTSLGSFEIKAVLYDKKKKVIDTLSDSLKFSSKKVRNNSFSLKYKINPLTLKCIVYIHNINIMKIYDILVVKYIMPKISGSDELETKEISLRGHDLNRAFSFQSYYSQDYELKAKIYLKNGTYVEKTIMIEGKDINKK